MKVGAAARAFSTIPKRQPEDALRRETAMTLVAFGVSKMAMTGRMRASRRCFLNASVKVAAATRESLPAGGA